MNDRSQVRSDFIYNYALTYKLNGLKLIINSYFHTKFFTYNFDFILQKMSSFEKRLKEFDLIKVLTLFRISVMAV